MNWNDYRDLVNSTNSKTINAVVLSLSGILQQHYVY